jgi:hypothetical protein
MQAVAFAPVQHAWFSPPHASQVPPAQRAPEAVQVPPLPASLTPQQGSLTAPQAVVPLWQEPFVHMPLVPLPVQVMPAPMQLPPTQQPPLSQVLAAQHA